MRYLNIKTNFGTETVDEVNPTEFPNYSEFCKELRRLLSEYKLAGMDVYSSNKACKHWLASS